MIKLKLLGLLLLASSSAFGTELTAYQTCILNAVETSTENTTIADLRGTCLEKREVILDTDILASRRLEEEQAELSRRALVPHRRNYLLPAAYAPDPNEKPVPPAFTQFFPDEDLDNVEMKFQLSLKYQFAKSVLMRNDQFHFALTTLSFWQAYNSDVSAPFRETNYEPEVFWTAPIEWQPLRLMGIDASEIAVGFSHQSNGQSGTLSRSWNRLYANVTWEAGNFVFGFKPWYRIREDDKDSILDPKGDDNPDIEKYMGHFEFRTTYRSENHEVTMMLRNNLRSENRGAVQLDWTFPIWRGLKGHAQYFNGYGESLIDYDRNVERIGFGLLLSDLY